MATKKGIVLATPQQFRVGDKFEGYPPHVSLTSPFKLELKPWGDLRAALGEIADENPGGLLFRASHEAWFGPGANQRVMVLGGHACEVAMRVQKRLNVLGADYDETYMSTEWVPHISDFRGMQPGDEFRTGFGIFVAAAGIKIVDSLYAQDAYSANEETN